MSVRILIGDVREKLAELPDESVHCVVTSPPYYGLRDYGVQGQIGLEPSPDAYISELVAVFREVRRVLRRDGTLWLNLGDSYGSGTVGRNDTERLNAGLANGHGGGSIANNTPRMGARSIVSGCKPKDLLMIPARVALALQSDGWWLRSDIIWHKPNPMPESVTDRPTSAHEHVFLLAKSERYYFDAEAVREPVGPDRSCSRDPVTPTGQEIVTKELSHKIANKSTATPRNDGDRWNENNGRGFLGNGFRNIRNVWTIPTQPYSEAHFATFPPALIEPCIKAGCPENGTVLDPFGGAGTTGLVADRLKRNAILIELNPAYAEMAKKRIQEDAGMFGEVA